MTRVRDQMEGVLVSDRAAEWFVRLHDSPSPGQQRNYWRWLKKSQEHVAAALDIGRLYGLLREMKLPPGIDDPEPPSNVVELFPDKRRYWRTVQPAPRSRAPSWRVAAIVLTGMLGSLLTLVAVSAWREREIETAASEWRVQGLADGSRVRIGPRARLRIDFDGRRRLVHLMAGDVLFEVAKDAKRPFIVDTGFGTARAVGTEFGVTRYDDRMVVTVAEGVVAVARDDGTSNSSRLVEATPDKAARITAVALFAGDQVSVSSRGLDAVRPVDVERELAWVHGKLIFENQTIGEAVREFNCRNSVQLKVPDSAIAALSVQGVFDAADPRSFAEFLDLAETIEVRQEGPDVLRMEAASGDTLRGHETAPLQAEER